MTGFHDFPPLPQRMGWAAALVRARDAEGRHLCQLRDDRPGLPGAGLWGFFGGAVEAGETLPQAACREFLEETGIALTGDDLTPLARIAAMRSCGILHVFDCVRPIAPSEVRLGEGAGFAFLTEAQIAAWPVVPRLAELARLSL